MAEAEALLVDAEWHAPEPVEVGTSVATEGIADAVDAEPQRSLFSWAEFLADAPEESLPPRARRRDEAATLSLFEWALEQERKAELASAAG